MASFMALSYLKEYSVILILSLHQVGELTRNKFLKKKKRKKNGKNWSRIQDILAQILKPLSYTSHDATG